MTSLTVLSRHRSNYFEQRGKRTYVYQFPSFTVSLYSFYFWILIGKSTLLIFGRYLLACFTRYCRFYNDSNHTQDDHTQVWPVPCSLKKTSAFGLCVCVIYYHSRINVVQSNGLLQPKELPRMISLRVVSSVVSEGQGATCGSPPSIYN